MEVKQTELPGVLVLEPRVFRDHRGMFFESFNARRFSDVTGVEAPFVQDNHSTSKKNVLRGLHYQLARPQGKLVRVVTGEIYDVAVDLRRSSPTFRRWTGVRLSGENRLQVWIPPAFAHGFLVLSDEAQVLYKTTDYWSPEDERTIRWNDPDIGIQWPLAGEPVLSQKDSTAHGFREADLFP